MTIGTKENPIPMGSNGIPAEVPTPVAEVPPVTTPEVGAPAQAPEAAAPAPALLDAAPAQATFIPTGVSQIDDIANLLSTSKVAGKEAIIKNVLNSGQLSIADQIAISATLGESAATLIQNSLQSYTTSLETKATAETKRVKDYANSKFSGTDSELTWSQLQAFAAENVPADKRSEINNMLQSGGLSAQMAVDHIHSLYTGGVEQAAPRGQRLEGQSGGQSNFVPLSKGDYSKAVKEATEAHGYDSHQVKALQQRRTLSQQNGY